MEIKMKNGKCEGKLKPLECQTQIWNRWMDGWNGDRGRDADADQEAFHNVIMRSKR